MIRTIIPHHKPKSCKLPLQVAIHDKTWVPLCEVKAELTPEEQQEQEAKEKQEKAAKEKKSNAKKVGHPSQSFLLLDTYYIARTHLESLSSGPGI